MILISSKLQIANGKLQKKLYIGCTRLDVQLILSSVKKPENHEKYEIFSYFLLIHEHLSRIRKFSTPYNLLIACIKCMLILLCMTHSIQILQLTFFKFISCNYHLSIQGVKFTKREVFIKSIKKKKKQKSLKWNSVS